MLLDATRSLEYLKYRHLVLYSYTRACNAASNYFELDQAEDLDKRIKSLERHYDDLVFWRVAEIFDQLPPELVPSNNDELGELVQFMHTLNPVQPVKFKAL